MLKTEEAIEEDYSNVLVHRQKSLFRLATVGTATTAAAIRVSIGHNETAKYA